MNQTMQDNNTTEQKVYSAYFIFDKETIKCT